VEPTGKTIDLPACWGFAQLAQLEPTIEVMFKHNSLLGFERMTIPGRLSN
jgi:hypothetical protein